MIGSILHGVLLAFGLILPLGVQNIFVFNQGATQTKYKKALPVIITASLCDSLLIVLAILGVSVIVFSIYWLKMVLLVCGSIFLVYMGVVVWKSEVNSDIPVKRPLSAGKQITFAASVSLLNPHAIMDTIGVIGTSSLSYSGMEKITFTVACILVSWVWFFSLALFGNKVRNLDQSGKILKGLNKLSAIIMWATGVYLIYSIN